MAASATTLGTMTAAALYKIATISGTTTFPTGFEIGDVFLGDSAKSFSVGNSAYLITTTEMLDVNEFSIAFKADEIETTTLSDSVKKYRRGKTDMSGSVKGINTVTEMKTAGSVLNRFLRFATATAANVVTSLNAVVESDLYGVFYIQKDASTTGEFESFMVAQIELFGYNLGASVANAQSWDSGVRIIGNDPIVYFVAN